MDKNDSAPLILTIKINDEAQQFFDSLRTLYFPRERNFLNAHLTLFHHLPPAEPSIIDEVKSIASTQPPLLLKVDAVVSIGGGTAYKITSPELSAIHQGMQRKWAQWLIPQDKQKLWPHITVQNKVSTEIAKDLQEQLKIRFEPFEIRSTGFILWEYQGGPWKFVLDFNFRIENR